MVTSGCREVTDPVEVGFGCAGPGLVVELPNESQGGGWNGARPAYSREDDMTHLCVKMRGARDGVREGGRNKGRKIKKVKQVAWESLQLST